MLRELLPLCVEVVFTQQREPARAAAGDARVARRPARRRRRRGPSREPAPRAGRRARAGGPGRRRARHRLDLPLADLLRPAGARRESTL